MTQNSLKSILSDTAPPCDLARPEDDWWYSTDPGERELAKAVCRDCDLRQLCFQAAVDNDEPAGVWGAVDFTVDQCQRGHPYTVANTRHRKDGARLCRACACPQSQRQREKAA